jgi:serine/threonine protein kinase
VQTGRINLKEIRELVADALELPVAQREAFIERTLASKPEVARRVRELLAADAASVGPGTLEPDRGTPAVLVGEEIAPVAVTLVGSRVGPYEVEGLLGEGGMGAVYRARDERLGRVVALKVVRGALATPAMRRRFETESRTLARLKHPCIAEVYSAGVAQLPDSRVNGVAVEVPYFAMELVEGARTLSQFAKDLPFARRLALLIDVCHAVEHGHQRGVIHRDLKPANVLVGADGRPKVIDFGIARSTEGEARTQRTSVAGLVGTVRYMSPEQAAGSQDVDVRTDVYALGVIGYELLTGRHAFGAKEGDTTNLLTLLRSVQEGRPEPAAIVGAPTRRAARDAQTVIARAMERQRERRYASVAELVAELERLAQGEPVQARPHTALERLGAFARRNRALSASIGALVVALGAGVIGTSVGLAQARASQKRAEASEARAKTEADRARQVAAYVANVLASVTPVVSTQASADPLERAQTETYSPSAPWIVPGVVGGQVRSRDLLLAAFERSEAELTLDPLARAEICMLLARAMTRGVGEIAGALRASAQGLALLEQHAGPDDPRTIQALLFRADLLQIPGDYEQAERLWRDAQARAQRAEGAGGKAGAPVGVLRAMAFGGLVDNLGIRQGRTAEALEVALALNEQVLVQGAQHETLRWRAQYTLARASRLAGEHQRARELLQSVVQAAPAELVELRTGSLIELGQTLRAMGIDPEQEVLVYAQADQLQRASQGPAPQEGMLRRFTFDEHWAYALARAGRPEQAVELVRERAQWQRARYGLGDGSTKFDAELARYLIALGDLRQRREHVQEAERLLAEASAYRREHLAHDVGWAYWHDTLRAMALRRLGRAQEAADLLDSLIDGKVTLYGGQADTWAFERAMCDIDLGRRDRGEPVLLELRRVLSDSPHPRMLLEMELRRALDALGLPVKGGAPGR